MKRFVISIAVVALALFVANTASAGGIVVKHRIQPVPMNYHLIHGTKFNGGIFYTGQNHTHWTQRTYNTQLRATVYFDPFTNTWYYWYAPLGRFYPVGYVVR